MQISAVVFVNTVCTKYHRFSWAWHWSQKGMNGTMVSQLHTGIAEYKDTQGTKYYRHMVMHNCLYELAWELTEKKWLKNSICLIGC